MSHHLAAVTRAEAPAEVLHRVLFPIGERQISALTQISDLDPRIVLTSMQTAIADYVRRHALLSGATERVRSWLLLEDAPIAAELLYGLPVDDKLVDSFRRKLDQQVLSPDGIGDMHQSMLPADARHRMGEHYTPDWLVQLMVRHLPPTGVIGDPACGDGRFVAALARLGRPGHELWGADVNPLAVLMARYRTWLAFGSPKSPPCRIEWADFLLGSNPDLPSIECLAPAVAAASGLPKTHHFVGNPPWVTWRNLAPQYRSALALRTEATVLNSTRGWSARVAAAAIDLAQVFIHECGERVAPGGTITFVLPQSIVRASTGPAGLRGGRLTSGRKLAFDRIWDLSGLGAFQEVRADPMVGWLSVDRLQQYPVPWHVLARRGSAQPTKILRGTPSDSGDVSSPWSVTATGQVVSLRGGRTRATVRARGGINTGGGNGVFHVKVIEAGRDLAVIENIPSPRTRLPVVRREIEWTFLRPLLRGVDIVPWTTATTRHIVVPHGDDLRRPLDEATLRDVAPRTLDYLKAFESELSARKELQRWGEANWFALFRIGSYTADCWRVVWPHSSASALRAAVLSPHDRAVPDQKVVLARFEEEEPALFLCALLNSRLVGAHMRSVGALDASPNLVNRIPLPAWDPDDAVTQAVVRESRLMAAHPDRSTDALEQRISLMY